VARRAFAELHCFQSDGTHRPAGEGLNPLLGVFVGCFDDAAACEARAKAAATECTALVPRWYCYAMASRKPARDPLEGLTFCYPSLSLCETARTPRAVLDDDPPLRGPCNPTETVYCEPGEPSRCADSEVMCNLAGEAVAAALRGFPPHTPCVARHGVR
jgi:hypothetical protein